MHWRRKWQPTPVFLPGESQERGSLVGCHLWGRTELDMYCSDLADPEAAWSQIVINTAFVSQAYPDIRRKLQKVDGVLATTR